MRVSEKSKKLKELQKKLEKSWGEKPTKIVDKETEYKPPKKKK